MRVEMTQEFVAEILASMPSSPAIDNAPRTVLERCIEAVNASDIKPPHLGGRPDYRSVVLLEGSTAIYTDDEMRLLARLARFLTAAIDQTGTRSGANFFLIAKYPDFVMAYRLTWENPAYHRSIAEAVAYFYAYYCEPLTHDRIEEFMQVFDRQVLTGDKPVHPTITY